MLFINYISEVKMWPFKKSNSKFAVVSEKEAKIDPYPYVYVNDDGTVRELNTNERQYLETSFHPADGSVPYIKRTYKQRDGWGNISGFCHRKKIPSKIEISDPPVDEQTILSDQDVVDELVKLTKDKGFKVVEK